MSVNSISLDSVQKFQAYKQAYFLPHDFKVYTHGKHILNWNPGGWTEHTLPTYDDYLGEDGGYVALYTRDQQAGLYSVGGGIYVMGQVRVKGHYHGRIFIPEGYRPGDNITRDPQLLETCKKYFPEMRNDFWVGGDTGGWFGIPG